MRPSTYIIPFSHFVPPPEIDSVQSSAHTPGGKTRRSRGIAWAVTFAALVTGLSPGSAWAQDNETCETCHDDPDHKVIRYGVELSLYVTSEHLAESPHKDFACIDCHTELEGVDDWPHRERLVLPDCGSCHEEEQAVFVEGFFGPLMQKGYTSIPNCSDCHGRHTVSWTGHPRKVCGVCHQDILSEFLAIIPISRWRSHATRITSGRCTW